MNAKHSSIHVWDGCSPFVASAIANFFETWGPYSAQSRHYSLFRLLFDTVDEPVQAYAMSLPRQHLGLRVGVPGINGERISAIARTCGFEVLESAIRKGLRRYMKIVDPTENGYHEFVQTIETLVELAFECGSKKPKSGADRNSVQSAARRGRGICIACGRMTELAAFEHGVVPPLASSDTEVKLRFSRRYCSVHRPMPRGDSNANYKRTLRSQLRFDTELDRISRQTVRLSVPLGSTGDPLIDQFLWNFVGHLALYPGETEMQRAHARELVDARISDRKKQILMLVALGKTQSAIARQLGISRQAVSKALKSTPFRHLEFGCDSLRTPYPGAFSAGKT